MLCGRIVEMNVGELKNGESIHTNAIFCMAGRATESNYFDTWNGIIPCHYVVIILFQVGVNHLAI